ncbi:hypothetical protein G6F70_005924 [Rhizopus microsporus]|nr:hypothetical protein G6F71_005776 [Rhizopus microsporus]KAG1198288.1 hypothetical protein G6F70_005924 [Rhizopus microsporus]KAG1212210.1 hypothetical protein G6F69_003911 [Rhizopus microsporus]KAG1231698.1 hypothetical protein G6F67_005559 [Rhizopus microsporus]KAG1264004.1 hypothetical protein G6F68_004695 [Rhizopus microsporus]
MTTTQEFIAQLDQLTHADGLDEVLECIQIPLGWLNITESPLTASQQLALVQHKAWRRHLWHLFHTILPNWTFSLSPYKEKLLSTLWLKDQRPEIGAVMAKTSLTVLLECITQEVPLDTLETYTAGLKHVTLGAYKLYPSQIEHDQVDLFCSLLCSVPGRLVNAFGGHQQSEAWYSDKQFYPKLAKLAAQHASQSVGFTSQLLCKMIRQGYEDSVIASIIPVAIQSSDVFPAIFERMYNTLSSFDTVIKSILHYGLTHHIRAHQIACILFTSQEQTRIKDFLMCALVRLARWSLADQTLARLATATAKHAGLNDWIECTKQVIHAWSDTVFIKHASLREKRYVSTSVLVLLSYLEDDDIRYHIMPDTRLIRSVSFYLDSGDIETAKLGALVAEATSSRIDKENALNMGLLDEDKELQALRQIVFKTEEDDEQDKQVVPAASFEEEQEDTDEEEKEMELDPDAAYHPQDDSDDEFQAYAMEDESDDEGVRRDQESKEMSKKPAFVQDLVRYLRRTEDPVSLRNGLNEAEAIIRKSIGVGTTLKECGQELAKYLVYFPETYEIEDFRQLQQDALQALIVGAPDVVTGYIIDLMYDRNTNMGQVQTILASIALAVRELAGWVPVDKTKGTEKQIDALADQLGVSLFVSKRIELERNRPKAQKNRLAGLAGPVFFFPLLVGWWEGSQGRLKYWIGNNPNVVERFIMTLNIIMHSSTNTPDKRRIVREYFEFAFSMRYFQATQCQKALLLGIETILNVSYKGQESLLFNDFMSELINTKEWLEEQM